MAAGHLVTNCRYHILEIKLAGIRGDLAVKHHLEQQVAKFVPESKHIIAMDGVRHLIGFLDRIRRDRLEVLHLVPVATILRIAQAPHDFEQGIDQRGILSDLFIVRIL